VANINDVNAILSQYRANRARAAKAFAEAAREPHPTTLYQPNAAAIARRDRDWDNEANGFTCRHKKWLWESCPGCRRLKTDKSARYAALTLWPRLISRLRQLINP
jgi:hypothetical protein